MVSAPWLGSGLRLRLCQVAAWNVRGSAADRERLVDDVRDRLLGYPPLPARLPGVGGAGYRVFTANGSLNRTRLAPKAVCTRPAPRLRGHEGHIGRQPPASDHASWPGEPAPCRAGATCQGARVPGALAERGRGRTWPRAGHRYLAGRSRCRWPTALRGKPRRGQGRRHCEVPAGRNHRSRPGTRRWSCTRPGIWPIPGAPEWARRQIIHASAVSPARAPACINFVTCI